MAVGVGGGFIIVNTFNSNSNYLVCLGLYYIEHMNNNTIVS